MTKKELTVVLENHAKWVKSRGKEGERANLEGAYL